MNNVCVLIPVYNNQTGLERTLASLSADCGDFDVLVVDDGSACPIIVPPQTGSHEVTLLRLPQNKGITGALNVGLEWIIARQYAYVGRIDSGDAVVGNRLLKQMRYLDANPDHGLVGCFIDFHLPNRPSAFIYRCPSDHEGIVERMRIESCLIHAGVMMRTSVLRDTGSYNTLRPVTEDYDLFLRISRRAKVAVIPEVLTRCEYNVLGISVARRREQQRHRLMLQIRYFDAAKPASYVGIARTLLAMMTPQSFVLAAKSRLWSAQPAG